MVISGPSGVGKTTICQAIVERLRLVRSISATTRPPRPGDTDGVDYYFISEAEFHERLSEDGFVEHAEVFGHLYGTPKGELSKASEAGRPLLLEIDVQGGMQVKRRFHGALTILLVPPSADVLRQRLSGRGTDSPQAIEKRFAEAQREIDAAKASGAYNVEVVNDELETTIDEVERVIRSRVRI